MNDNDGFSRVRTTWLAGAWLLVGIVVYLSLARINIPIEIDNGDKVEHMLAYATLAFGFMQVYQVSTARVRIAAALVAMGIGLEILQSFTGYRAYEYGDMAANTIGVFIGWIASPPRTPGVLPRIQRLVSR